MRHRLPLIALVVLTLSGCSLKPLQVRPPQELAATTPMPVSGRQGWQIGRELRFGDYRTTPASGGSVRTRTTACPEGCSRVDLGLYKSRFEEALSHSKAKLGFTLLAPDGAQARVQAVGELDQQRREWMTRWFGLPTALGAELQRSITWVGTIEPDAPGLSAWRFVIWESEGGLVPGHRQGWAEDAQGRRLILQSLNRWQGDEARGVPTGLQALHLGYAFELDGRAIGAVDTVGNGTVWMQGGLSPDLRMVVASFSSALLLRADLGSQPAPTLSR